MKEPKTFKSYKNVDSTIEIKDNSLVVVVGSKKDTIKITVSIPLTVDKATKILKLLENYIDDNKE